MISPMLKPFAEVVDHDGQCNEHPESRLDHGADTDAQSLDEPFGAGAAGEHGHFAAARAVRMIEALHLPMLLSFCARELAAMNEQVEAIAGGKTRQETADRHQP